MKKHGALLVTIFSLISASLLAQQTEVIDEILLEDTAAFGKAIYLVLAAAGLVPDDVPIQEALRYLAGAGWGVRIKEADEPLKSGELCYVVMKAFGISGGLFYSIFPGPRYAARELKYLGFFTGNYAVGRSLSGEEVLRILGKALAWKEEQS